jgi:hypothetical protein
MLPLINLILFKEKTGKEVMEMGGKKNVKETVMFNLSSARKMENYCEMP